MQQSSSVGESKPQVSLCGDLRAGSLEGLFSRFGIEVSWVGDGADIPGSHWGAPEAGILANKLLVRRDTPVHSALHEGGHLICMGPERRKSADTDAGGDDLEESGVCVLQILLADELETGADQLMLDMDAWGYSFRLGSTRAWFTEDAEDAWDWLEIAGLVRDGRLAPP